MIAINVDFSNMKVTYGAFMSHQYHHHRTVHSIWVSHRKRKCEALEFLIVKLPNEVIMILNLAVLALS